MVASGRRAGGERTQKATPNNSSSRRVEVNACRARPPAAATAAMNACAQTHVCAHAFACFCTRRCTPPPPCAACRPPLMSAHCIIIARARILEASISSKRESRPTDVRRPNDRWSRLAVWRACASGDVNEKAARSARCAAGDSDRTHRRVSHAADLKARASLLLSTTRDVKATMPQSQRFRRLVCRRLVFWPAARTYARAQIQ